MHQEIIELSRNFLKIKNSKYRRYFIQSTNFKHRLSIVIGQRGVGKTTTLIQLLLDYVNQDAIDPRILYVQADHFQLGKTTLYEIAEEFYQHGGLWIAFDEIHKYPDWSKELKSIYDTFPKLKVLASGSSALEIYQGSHDLTRRAICYHMHGLSFREYLELTYGVDLSTYTLEKICNDHAKIADQILEMMNAKNAKILQAFHRYTKVGYYPYFQEVDDDALYLMTLEQNLHTTIESDLLSIFPNLKGSSVAKLKQLLKFIAHEAPFVPNWKKIQTATDVPDNRTLKNYFRHLQDADLIQCLDSATQKMSQMEHLGKIFLNNTNQLYAIGSLNPAMGTLRETFFLSMLKVHHQVQAPKTGDFLVDGKRPFEIGDRKKTFNQIKDHGQSFLACDGIEIGSGNRIPLWLFGFLY